MEVIRKIRFALVTLTVTIVTLLIGVPSAHADNLGRRTYTGCDNTGHCVRMDVLVQTAGDALPGVGSGTVAAFASLACYGGNGDFKCHDITGTARLLTPDGYWDTAERSCGTGGAPSCPLVYSFLGSKRDVINLPSGDYQTYGRFWVNTGAAGAGTILITGWSGVAFLGQG